MVMIAILSTVIVMMTFLYIVSLITVIKSIQKGWVKIEKPDNELIEELDELYKETLKEQKMKDNQLNLAMELCEEKEKKNEYSK